MWAIIKLAYGRLFIVNNIVDRGLKRERGGGIVKDGILSLVAKVVWAAKKGFHSLMFH